MSIKQFSIIFPGQIEVNPRIGHLYAPDDTLATISAAGYLNLYITAASVNVLVSDVILAHGSDGTQWYKPVFTGTSVQLTVLP